MSKSRSIGPILAVVVALGGGLYYQTAGGRAQPHSVSGVDADKQIGISERLQGAAGTGGASARKEPLDYDPKDTRQFSRSPTADSKRNPQKTTDTLPHDGMSGLYGKHAGDPESDLPWKQRPKGDQDKDKDKK